MTDTVAASVVIPTIGQPGLAECLDSLAACRPRAAEVILVDQSESDRVTAAAAASALPGLRVVPCRPLGIAVALNRGLLEASQEVVLMTNDDCTVAPSWIRIAWDRLSADGATLLTGRVLPAGDPMGVPSTFTQPYAEELTGRHVCDRLYGANMAFRRRAALRLGGWDDLLAEAAEDNDFGYRWLRAGGRMLYDPDLVIWHHHWRSPDQLRRQFERYARGQGAFYGKTLYDGDIGVLRFLLEDVRWGARGYIARAVGRGPAGPWPDQRFALFPALPRGLRAGWRGAAARTHQLHGRRLSRESRRIREDRRRPLPIRWDYLHLRHLRDDLRAALAALPESPRDVLDLYCGTRPYEHLLPRGAEVTGLDINNDHGVADVVSEEFLPFDDESFDLVLCAEAFHYVPDPGEGVRELGRVLRPGGSVIVSVPLVWEYNPAILEHRYTGPELAELFAGWDDVRVIANGERAVAWATLTGRLLNLGEERLAHRSGATRAAFAGAYLALNGLGALAHRAERRMARGSAVLPMNLLLTARRP